MARGVGKKKNGVAPMLVRKLTKKSRPRLSAAYEAQLKDTDDRSRECYNAIEDLVARAANIAAEIQEDPTITAGVIEEVIEDGDSFPHCIEDAQDSSEKMRADSEGVGVTTSHTERSG